MHLWTYLVLRNGGGQALADMIQSGNWNTDACLKAGEAVLALNALKPYQAGYKAADYNAEAAAVGNGKAAMELMGQWAPSVQNDQSVDKKGLGDKLGWFAFPVVTGGAGAATDGVGGGNGIAVGKDAPPEAIDFLKFFNSVENQTKLNTDGIGLSTTVGTETAISDPNLQAVLAGRGAAQFMQLYLDQATSPAMGSAINDATVGAVPRHVDARGGLPGHHGRGGRAVADAVPVAPVRTSDRAGRPQAGPLDLHGRREVGDELSDRPAPVPGRGCRARLADHHPVPAARSGAVRRCSSCSRSSRPPTTACTSGTASSPLTDFIGLDNYVKAFNDKAFTTAVSNNLLILVLSLVDPDPVLARARRAAQPPLPRPGGVPAPLLPALRPVRGDHGHRVLADAAAGCRWSTRA